MSEQLVGKISSMGVFNGASPSLIQELLTMGILVSFKAGETLFEHVSSTQSIHCLLDGALLVYGNSNGQRKVLSSLSGGDLFSESVLFNNVDSKAFVECFQAGELFSFPQKEFFRLLQQNPKLFSKVMDRLFYRALNPKHLIVENFDKLLHKQEKTEKESQLKSVFLGIVSHELKTPLTSIMAWPQMIRNCNMKPDLVVKAMDAIERNSQKLKEIVDDLLDFASIENNKFQYHFLPFSLEDILTDTIETVLPQADKKQMIIHFSGFSGSSVLKMDRKRINQVASNLLVNAIKFSPKGSEIQVTLTREGDRFVTAIKDQGIGIEEKDFSLIFEQFKQLEHRDIRKHGGVGLGLPLAKRFLEDHGGGISVSSVPGEGSLFSFWLPVDRS